MTLLEATGPPAGPRKVEDDGFIKNRLPQLVCAHAPDPTAKIGWQPSQDIYGAVRGWRMCEKHVPGMLIKLNRIRKLHKITS